MKRTLDERDSQEKEGKQQQQPSLLKAVVPVAKGRGKVLVDKLPGRFSGKKWPVVEGYKNVNVCSGAAGSWKQLSPMLLGPISPTKWGWNSEEDYGKKTYGITMPLVARNLENLWYFIFYSSKQD
jgi:hypothetical protein